jgi:hypothetical protein
MNIINKLPIQWWVIEYHPSIIVTPMRLSRPGYERQYKTTWWNVLTGKHRNQKLRLGKP